MCSYTILLKMLVAGQIPAVSDNAITLGHEATGQVVSVGGKVTGFKKGDYVGFINAHYACFKCRNCKNHYIHCSEGRMVMQGFSSNGFFQEYSAIDAGTAVVLPEKMDPGTSSPIFCAGITGMPFDPQKTGRAKTQIIQLTTAFSVPV